MRFLTIPIVVGLMVFVACVNTTDTGDGVPHDQTTVLGTLLLFEDVWNNGDMLTYSVLLDEDTFTFFFATEDTGDDIPVSWGYTEEIMAVTNLFDAVGAENVDVALDLSEVEEPEGDADTYQVNGIPYDVRLYDENADPCPTMYRAVGRLDMELKWKDGEWVITVWWDKASSLLAGVCETSWGALKALY